MMHQAMADATPRRRVSDLAIERATAGIAPAWPLDRLIAVNPAHGCVDRRFEQVAAEFAATAGARLLPPRSVVRELWRARQVGREHLAAALAEAAGDDQAPTEAAVDALAGAMHEDGPTIRRLPLLSDFADAHRPDGADRPWSQRVVEQIARFAASWFDRGQSNWSPDRRRGLFAAWRARLAGERSVPTRSGRRALRAALAHLPDTARALVDHAVERLGIEPAVLDRVDYLGALLSTVRGWASWCAHERWQARLRGGDDDVIVELLAVRLAWEVLLLDDLGLHDLLPRFRRQLLRHPDRVGEAHEAQRDDRLLLRAVEIACHGTLAARITALPVAATPAAATPEAAAPAAAAPAAAATVAAAVFCIDVRSERFRRALERESDGAIATHGFAGFFGLPVAMTSLGTHDERPRLPGLFAPTLAASEDGPDPERTATIARRRSERLGWRQRWARFRSSPGSAFAFVETCGLLSLGAIVRDAFMRRPAVRPEHAGLTPAEQGLLQPCWAGDAAVSVAQRANFAASALRGMGLVRDLPPVVLFVGHGSTSRNNAHAAALDCGACGGHSGHDSARLLARTLMDPAVRDALRDHGIAVPAGTQFVAACHDTTTDEVAFAAAAIDDAVAQRLRSWLAQAGERARAERAPGLGLSAQARDPVALLAAMRDRAGDWAQVRPEWGLAGNAALVFAPRDRTRGADLGGRVFLHDYHADDDPDGGLLAQLFSAPMQVATWINLQYYASVVDPRAFGGGNKVLHDVVGGRLGVYEGNGGDLRVGLPMQSLHDGRRWRHAPVRLAVYVAADEARIERALAASEPGRRLVENGWLHLLRLADDGTVSARGRQGGWRTTTPQPATYVAPEPLPPPPRRVVELARVHGMALAMALIALALALRARYVA
ncbi:MAG: putative inorganic carbon transporter subunit DabA [Planctomycetota bacterium]